MRHAAAASSPTKYQDIHTCNTIGILYGPGSIYSIVVKWDKVQEAAGVQLGRTPAVNLLDMVRWSVEAELLKQLAERCMRQCGGQHRTTFY